MSEIWTIGHREIDQGSQEANLSSQGTDYSFKEATPSNLGTDQSPKPSMSRLRWKSCLQFLPQMQSCKQGRGMA